MINITNILFYIGLSLLLVHELDAIKRKEWRIFPLLSKIKDDDKAYYIFAIFHVPIFATILFFINHPNLNIQKHTMLILDIFFVIHSILHYLFRSRKENEFNNRFSSTIIYLMATIGALHLVAESVIIYNH